MNDELLKTSSQPYYTGKLFRVAGRPYFFNTVAGSVDAISENTASVLAACSNNHGGCDVPRADPTGEDLRPFINSPYDHAEIKRTLDRKLRLLVLELTRSCNMACRYCIDSEAYNQKDCFSSTNMHESVALRGVDYLLEHSSDQTYPLAISFYGGEPLLRFSTLEKVVQYARKRAEGQNREIGFSVTTNGTLLTTEIAGFLIKNSIQTVISLDGPMKSHDRYRRFKKDGCGTFQAVISGLEMIRQLDADYFDRFVRCSVVVTPKSDLSELQTYFNELHVNIIANFVDTYGIDESIFGNMQGIIGLSALNADISNCIKEEGVQFLDKRNISKDFKTVLLSPMIKRFFEYNGSSKQMSLGQCILGASRLYLAADHTFYPCEKVAGHSFCRIGTIESGIDVDRVVNLVNQFYETVGGKCSGCWLSSRCSACLALGCSGDHFDMKKYDYYCRAAKVWGESALKIVASAQQQWHKKANSADAKSCVAD